MGEYDYNLQKALDSFKQTPTPNTRYEWAGDLSRLGNAGASAVTAYAKATKENAKDRNAELGNLFDQKVTEAIGKHTRTPGATQSALDDDINKIIWDPQFSTLSMETKNSILSKRNYSRPLIPAIEANKLASEAQAKKDAEEQQRYVDITNSTYDPDEIANMTQEAKVQEGRRLAAENFVNTTAIPPLLNSALPEDQKYEAVSLTANSLSKAISRDLVMNLKQNPDQVTPEWWNKRRIEWKKQLEAAGYPPKYADYAIWKAGKFYEPLFSDIKQSREDFVKYAQQGYEALDYTTKRKELEELGVSPSRMDEFVKNYQYYPENVREKIDPLLVKQFESAEAMRNFTNKWKMPQSVYDDYAYYFSDPLATSNQKQNITNAGNDYIANAYDEAVRNGQSKSGDYQDAMSYNVRTLVQSMTDNAPAFADAYKKYSTPKSKALYQQNFNRMLTAALKNDLARLGRDSIGAVSYENGQFKSTNTIDKYRIQEINGLLGNLRAINKTLGGDLLDEQAMATVIQEGIADNALEISTIPAYKGNFLERAGQSILNDLTSTVLAVQAAGGRLVGDEDYEFLALNPRQAALNQRNRALMQESAVENLRKARVENALGPGSYPAPQDDRGFTDFVLEGAAWLAKAPIRSIYNAPQWAAKKIQESGVAEKALEAGKSAVEAARQGAKELGLTYDYVDMLHVPYDEEAVSRSQAKQEASKFFNNWNKISDERQEVLTEIVYEAANHPDKSVGVEFPNAGRLTGLKEYVEKGNYETAADSIYALAEDFGRDGNNRAALANTFLYGKKLFAPSKLRQQKKR